MSRFLDIVDLNEVISHKTKGLGKFFPDFQFQQVDSTRKNVEVKITNKKLISEKSFLGFIYGKKYEYQTKTDIVYFEYRYEFYSTWYGDEFEIEYAVSYLNNTIYWKLDKHRRK